MLKFDEQNKCSCHIVESSRVKKMQKHPLWWMCVWFSRWFELKKQRIKACTNCELWFSNIKHFLCHFNNIFVIYSQRFVWIFNYIPFIKYDWYFIYSFSSLWFTVRSLAVVWMTFVMNLHVKVDTIFGGWTIHRNKNYRHSIWIVFHKLCENEYINV